ncbi:hypothetical protein Mapa_005278 [Marchantia paleacea]|nr:hypothetical protein Mapa_005278 [Marchantia paleacea]
MKTLLAVFVLGPILQYNIYNTRQETEAWKKRDPELIHYTHSHQDETIEGNILKRTILVRLVYGIYHRLRKKSAFKEWWTTVHYDWVPLEYILTPDETEKYIEELKKEEERKYFGVFVRNKERPSSVAPGCVVAIRGTDVRNLCDIRNNYKIWIEMLHTSSLSRLLEVVILRLCAKHGYSNVCVTGHSLGAAAGMLVCRRLALKDCPVESHFFNPPFGTLELFMRKEEQPNMSSIYGDVGNHMRDKVLHAMGDAEKRSKAFAEFKALAASKWSPYLYVNEHDFVCCEYLSHFEMTADRSIEEDWKKWFSPEISRNFLPDKETFHLIPAAVLCRIKNYSGTRVSAHMLLNWIDPHIPCEVKHVKLM